MHGKMKILKAALLVFALGLIGLLLGWDSGSIWAQPRGILPEVQDEPLPEKDKLDFESGKEFPVPLAPLPKTITPCRSCHGPEKDFPVNPKRREDLLVHKNVKLHHGGVRVWCLDCHNPDDRNYLLPLSDGKPIKFEQSYLLCGKCHGTKFRDWRLGIHGKRTGYWNGEKTYALCVSCHDPHSPKFKPIKPMPPPHKPWTPKETQVKH
jgi:cytochrome c553